MSIEHIGVYKIKCESCPNEWNGVAIDGVEARMYAIQSGWTYIGDGADLCPTCAEKDEEELQ